MSAAQTQTAPAAAPVSTTAVTKQPTTVAHVANTKDLLDLVTQRRSNYTLTPASTISDAEIQEILKVTLTQAPSTFGSYTTRMVLAVREQHFELWDAITEIVKGVTPPEKWEEGTKQRMAGFRNAYGTVLFFEDPTNTKALQEQFPFIKHVFPTFGQHTNAMHQFVVWTAFSSAGLGASLQHYSALIEAKVKEMYHLPADWSLVAELVFGTPSQPAQPKPTAMAAPMEDRLRVFGADAAQQDIIDEKQNLVEEGTLEKLSLQKTTSKTAAQ